MLGAAGGAGWSSLEEEAVDAAAPSQVAAVTGSAGSEFEIILPSSHFSFLHFFFLFLSLQLSFYFVPPYFTIFFGPHIYNSSRKRPHYKTQESKKPNITPDQ